MVGDGVQRGEARSVSRYDVDTRTSLVKAVTTFARIQPPSLNEMLRDSTRRLLQDYQDYKFEVARVTRGGIPLVPARLLGLMRMCRPHVLRDLQNGGQPMDENRCFRA